MHRPHGIALCCSTQSLGGIELNVLRLAGWMTVRGHRCTLVLAEGSPLHERATAEGLPVVTLTARSRYKVRGEARMLARRFAEEGIDTLILNVNRDLLLGVLTKRRLPGLTLLHTQHMQFGRSKRDAIHRWQHRQLDAWIAPLPSLAEQTARMTAVPRERIHVIPLGIELAPFGDLPAQSAARQELGLPENAFIAGVLGRLDRGKGQEYLLRAAAMLRSEGRTLHLLIVGEETRGEQQGYARHLQQLASGLHISDIVHFRGFVREIPAAYAAMDVFTLTSLSETYGMVTIEALAAGRPVIATESGGTPDILGGIEEALLVPPADARSLANALSVLMDDPALAKRLGERGRAHAFARYGHDRQCASIESLLDDLRGERPEAGDRE